MTVKCPPKNLALEYAGKSRSRYLARIPVGTSVDDVCDPAYFGALQASKQLMVGDIIECEWEDYSCFFELQVRAQSTATAHLITRLRGEVHEDNAVEIPKGWEIKWLGGDAHYGIYHEGQAREQGFLTQESCAVRIGALDAKAEQVKSVHRAAAPSKPTTKRAKAAA